MAADIPIEHVIELRNQGLSNNQIIQNLQRYGFQLDQINNAINQADLKEGITTTPYQMMDDTPSAFGVGGGASAGSPPRAAPPQGMQQGMMPGGQDMAGSDIPLDEEERIHEIAESIIDEKWASLIENVNKILDWKDATESRISKMEQSIEDLKHSFDKLHEGVLGRIGDYDKSMVDLGTEIKALEKVFQKILPSFMENVSELSRITQRVKKAGVQQEK
ncbi:hypothetical protein HYU19_04780 [Candidatus Woesearchaeota archaeon]|nr:hypothetical protein [Candidatus Woesearchaeota archaeon]